LSQYLLIAIASIITLGIAAEWIAWRIGLPSILVLLLFGMVVGPFTGLLDPDLLFGDLLFPVVSVSVAIILFEGGTSLRLQELRQVGRVVTSLVTVGPSSPGRSRRARRTTSWAWTSSPPCFSGRSSS